MSEEEDISQIQVKFVSVNGKHVVSDTPFSIPIRLRRYGLSEIINYLLNTTQKPIPFDFLINGEFLRTSIQKYLQAKNISSETLLTIEYVESTLPPSTLSGYQHDEWVSCVKGSDSYVLSGSYDNLLRVWDHSHNCLLTMSGHTKPIKSVDWLKSSQNSMRCVTASDDQTLRIWKFSPENNVFETTHELVSHMASVSCVSVNKAQTRFVSASWDGTLKIWDANPSTTIEDSKKSKSDSKKRGREIDDVVQIKEPLITIDNHSQSTNLEAQNCSITSVAWSHQTDIIASGGWDSTINIWDSNTATNTLNLPTDKALNSLSISPLTNLIVSGHVDNTTRIWDPRVKDGVVVKIKLVSHTGWVSSVCWSETNNLMFASGSYDKSVKIWDVRSSTAIHTLNTHKDKVLSVDWSKELVLSGGTDNTLYLHKTVIPQ